MRLPHVRGGAIATTLAFLLLLPHLSQAFLLSQPSSSPQKPLPSPPTRLHAASFFQNAIDNFNVCAEFLLPFRER